MYRLVLSTLAIAAVVATTGASAKPALSPRKLWTHAHRTPGQVSEIPAFDSKTNTIWVAGVVGVDVLDAGSGRLVTHIDVTAHGFVNSVAIYNGLAALAVEAAPDRRQRGKVLLYDTRRMQPAAGINQIPVGPLPDMLTFTHDGNRLLVANEGTPNAVADAPYVSPDPVGSVTIINMKTRTVLATATPHGVPQSGSNLRTNSGMDFEPEYITVAKDGSRAFVTLQEANAIGVIDLGINAFTDVIGLGAKDFNAPGNELDPKNDGTIDFIRPSDFVDAQVKGLYLPDAIASYKWRGSTYLVLANEGDFREDNADRSNASGFGGINPFDALRVSNRDSSAGNLFAAGARSFSIRDSNGGLVYDSGNILDREANDRGIYDDSRSRDKGVEPEGVELLEMNGRTIAFVGLERTLKSAVAIFDVTNPYDVEFLDMLVTDGDLAPEGLAAYNHQGKAYLAIANEAVAEGRTYTHTTVYRLDAK